MPNVVVVLAGAGLLATSAWSWTGRSRRARWWVGRPFGPQLVLGAGPGLGLVVLGAGLSALAGPPVALVALPPLLLGAVLELAGIFDVLPRWWGPRWYRELPGRRQGSDTTGAVAAAMAGLLGRPAVTSAAEAAARLGQAKPLGSWRGGWVYDADTGERVHGMSRRGTIDGRLTLYPSGVVFTASRVEDALRGGSTVLVLDAGDITEARVVPPRAGADGRPRRGRLHRSWFPRLVIRTGADAHVFDVGWGRAREVAERLAALGRERA